MTEGVQGLVIGDKGYISAFLQAELATTGIDLPTPLRASKAHNDELIGNHRLQGVIDGMDCQSTSSLVTPARCFASSRSPAGHIMMIAALK